MSENLDPPVQEPMVPFTGLPTTDGESLYGRRLIANRYEILSRLGSGGMGEVWHAYDLKLRVDVALKSLRLDLQRLDDRVEALRREVRTAREVISPNVCRIFDLVVEEKRELISMEYIDGITLSAMLVKKGRMELREARDIAAQFLAGLEAIHQAGLVHRDLKPENIMITRTGRVVVMDFGIAKQVTQLGGTISGTPPYMSPEQLAGEKVDARSDVFSAGVVLAEMIHPEGVFSQKTREGIWDAVRKHPMQLPDTPWKAVIARAVAANPEERFPSTGALARALEEVTLRVETVEERKPYPGLAAFTASDAEYFFGRELEVETVIKKLQQLHLMALIGPSGAGKTSFLRAGLIPVLPSGWNYVFCTPGDTPLVNLGQALVPELSGDTEAMRKMVSLEDTDTALWLLRRWREKHPEALLIVDRFEELFTLNNHDAQSRFAELLGRAALEADVRVLLAMRDDFLMQCHDHTALVPIFSELTGLSPLSGPSLRRALVQPALRCNYRFEDETLVDEILADVEKERGALPLMAFAASKIWEKRDRQTGQLTRAAYKEIGGVAGALAQHAEQTMDRIGTERQPIVREIFRNLITAQNTRAARDTEDLLSVFPDKQSADEVLRTLIDARLITSFEAPQAEGENPKRRVEIIHESLLTNWPRLVRWQTQDADSAQLRDQLRQAAQLWEQRSRSEDLLWTGAAYREYQLWRDRYSGGLTTTEEAFAQAMGQRANKRRKQRRIAISAVILILVGILVVVSNFWLQATVARDNAIQSAKRAEASKILTVARAKADTDPSSKLAYALASLEVFDTDEGRRFALQALSEGPPAQVIEMPIRPLTFIQFSPDGKWIAAGGVGGAQLVPRDGGTPVTMSESWPKDTIRGTSPQFSPDGQLVIWRSPDDPKIVNVWSIHQRKVVRTLEFEGYTIPWAAAGRAYFITRSSQSTVIIRSWTFKDQEPIELGRFAKPGNTNWDFDSRGKWIAYTKERGIYIRSLEGLSIGVEQLLGSHKVETIIVTFHPDGDRLVSADFSGEIRLWPIVAETKNQFRVVIPGGEGLNNVWRGLSSHSLSNLWFDSRGRFLAGAPTEDSKTLRRWDLAAPEGAEPMVFRHMDEGSSYAAFDRENRWMAIAWHSTLALYPLTYSYPYIFKGKGNLGSLSIRFTPDGKSFLNGFFVDGLRWWNVPGEQSQEDYYWWKPTMPNVGTQGIDIDPSGKHVIAATTEKGLHTLSISDRTVLPLQGLPGKIHDSVAFSPDGRFAAASAGGPPENRGIEIWDLQTRTGKILEQSKGKELFAVKYAPDGTLYYGDNDGNLTGWNPNDESSRILGKGKGMVIRIAITKDGHYLAANTLSAKRIGEISLATSELVLYNLKNGNSIPITSHGNRVFAVTFDPTGTKLVTGDIEGILRIGPISGETPHLIVGHQGTIADVAVHPNGEWLAATELWKPQVRLWRMPEGKPFHALPYNEFLNRLRGMTNVRVVADKHSSTGYRIEYAAFPGWQKAPAW